MSHPPTPEQQQVIDAYQAGTDLCVEAGAGTGKTSTLKMLAASTPRVRGVYLAFNRAIATDAARTFGSNVECKTAHGFAFAAVGKRYGHRLRSARVPARLAAEYLNIRQPISFARDKAPLAPQQLARLALATVARFCRSADTALASWHVPRFPGLDDKTTHGHVQAAILPLAERAWADILNVNGRLRFEHNHYLKMWGLSEPQLGADFVLFDEAQDANPVIAAIVDAQQSQRVVVGDRNQAIYGWNGAVDAMAKFDGQRLYLSQSFRFGQAVADEANKWLTILDAKLRLRGFDRITSTVGPVDKPDAVLCRTNAGAFVRVMDALQAGRRVALVGGGDDVKRLAEAALRLQQGQPCDHPELLAFSNWWEVRDYANNDPAGDELKVFVQLVDKLGADEIVRICNRLTEEQHADLIVSTAHKAKGREWSAVRIAGDFREPAEDPETGELRDIPREDAMLAYVSVTRAQHALDRAGLAWVDDWLPVGQYLRDPRARLAAVAAVAPEFVVPALPPVEEVSQRIVTEAAALLGPQPTLAEFLAPAAELRRCNHTFGTGPSGECDCYDDCDEEGAAGRAEVPAPRRCTPDSCRGLCDSVFPDRCLWPEPVAP